MAGTGAAGGDGQVLGALLDQPVDQRVRLAHGPEAREQHNGAILDARQGVGHVSDDFINHKPCSFGRFRWARRLAHGILPGQACQSVRHAGVPVHFAACLRPWGKSPRIYQILWDFGGTVFVMLSPTSLAGLSIDPQWARPVRAVSPAQGLGQGGQQPSPLTPLAPMIGGQQNGVAPSRTLPRGSLLDLSV